MKYPDPYFFYDQDKIVSCLWHIRSCVRPSVNYIIGDQQTIALSVYSA